MVISLRAGLVTFFKLVVVVLIIEVLTYGFLQALSWPVWPVGETWLFLGWQLVVLLLLWLFGVVGRMRNSIVVAQATQLAISQKKFAQLFERSPIPYVTINSHNKITLINLAALRFFGVTAEEIVGSYFPERLIINDENLAAIVLGRLDSGEVISDAEVMIRNDIGARRWIRLSVFAYGGREERLVSMIDITEQKLIDQAKSEFVALASHQLRTPISAMRWNIELLKSHKEVPYSEKQLGYFEKVDRNIAKMINLIDDFLSVSKLETGTFATEPKTIDLREFCRSVAEEYQQEVVKKQLTLTTDFPDALSITIDPRLLHITVSNLLSNAVKYCREQGIVTFGFEYNDQEVAIMVADSGIGIPKDDIPQLFNKFFRATNARLHKTEGTGLGLYVVKQAVEQMGGILTVSSEENVGTTFVVTLPLR